MPPMLNYNRSYTVRAALLSENSEISHAIEVGKFFQQGNMTVNRFIKFGLVGTSGIFVNTMVLFLLTSFVSMHYLVASVIATETAIISNFIGNDAFTFRGMRKSSLGKRFIRFQTVSLMTIVLTASLLVLLTSFFGLKYLLILNIIAIALTFILNFLLNSKFTWK